MIQKADFRINPPVPELSEEAKAIIPGIYEHYKKKRYEVIGIALNTETMEELVAYYDEHRILWVRPAKMFSEQVELSDGSIVPRFQRL